ncbi:ORF_35 [Catopsilia pomona nucleopolyhedrovirus]|uniref:ORF_35 n=1 Tax=Catopsilia pomona nucleopolyhedrovirus TaxID=1850906 RepID=A0A172WZB4_9ABAC|nr:ORF_35 [Catopsilia pomona nucleopolyhedrovirus]ANF29683.1 ORF_35 [Catopsilia pomona nucleopolyhedrovirus]
MHYPKIVACLNGVLLGDCIGRPYENGSGDGGAFDENNKRALDAQLKEIINDGNDSGIGNDRLMKHTDDTAMTEALMMSLLQNNFTVDQTDLAKTFARYYYVEPRRGYGRSIKNLFKLWSQSNYSDVVEQAKQTMNGQGSYGNGAAMRVAPVALFCHDDIPTMVNNVRLQAVVTHANDEAVDASILQALAIYILKNCKATNRTLFMYELLPLVRQYCSQEWHDRVVLVNRVLDNAVDTARAAEILGTSLRASQSVAAALYAFLKILDVDEKKRIIIASSYTMGYLESSRNDDGNGGNRRRDRVLDTIKCAVSMGGDTDTIGAMAGALAGAYYGLECMNDRLLNKCENYTHFNCLIKECITKFCQI